MKKLIKDPEAVLSICRAFFSMLFSISLDLNVFEIAEENSNIA